MNVSPPTNVPTKRAGAIRALSGHFDWKHTPSNKPTVNNRPTWGCDAKPRPKTLILYRDSTPRPYVTTLYHDSTPRPHNTTRYRDSRPRLYTATRYHDPIPRPSTTRSRRACSPPDHVGTLLRSLAHVQGPGRHSPRRRVGTGIFKVPEVHNEPFLHYPPGSPERKALREAIHRLKGECPDIPCIVGGKEIRTGIVEAQTMPTGAVLPGPWGQGIGANVVTAVSSGAEVVSTPFDTVSTPLDRASTPLDRAATLPASPPPPH